MGWLDWMPGKRKRAESFAHYASRFSAFPLLEQEVHFGSSAPLLTRELPQTCPKCGETGRFSACRSLNAALYPTLAAHLLSGRLFTWRCGRCSAELRVQHPLLYHGPREKLFLLWFPHRDRLTSDAVAQALGAASFPEPLSQGYRFRISVDFDDFVEKVRIVRAGLDDCAVEWLKYAVAEEGFGKPGISAPLKETMLSRKAQPRFIELAEHQGKDTLRFVYPVLPLAGMSAAMSVYFPIARYRRAVAEAARQFQLPAPTYHHFTVVDHDAMRLARSRIMPV